MSSADFKKVLVKDDRLNVSDSLSFAVKKGGQNVTVAKYKALSATTTSHVFNIVVPNEATIIDRRALWNATCTLKIQGIPAVGKYLVNYGYTDALAPFPLQSTATVMSSTINNTTVSVNIDDVMPALLRMHDARQLAALNSMTPTMFDSYKYYSDAVGAINNPLGSFFNAQDNDLLPRGAFGDVVVGSTYVGGVVDGAQVVGDGTTLQTTYVQFTTSEPLLGLSPFIWSNDGATAGIYGVTNMSFQFNLGNANRVWRTASNIPSYSVQLQEFNNSQLIFNYLTPHASDLMPARNIVPYLNLPRFISPAVSIGAGVKGVTISSQSLQLQEIPDKLICFVRKAKRNITNQDSDNFLPIKKVSIQWNNNSGILSTATPYNLYEMSKKAGCNENWLEFSGSANVVDNTTGVGSVLPTAGSMLVLDYAESIQLVEDWFSPGSLGAFNLQIDVTVDSNATTNEDYELVLVTVQSGIFVCERGQSSVYTALLSRQDVLEASEQKPYFKQDVKRMIGGGFLDGLRTMVGKLAPLAKGVLSGIDHPAARIGKEALSLAGYGVSGGAGKMSKRIA